MKQKKKEKKMEMNSLYKFLISIFPLFSDTPRSTKSLQVPSQSRWQSPRQLRGTLPWTFLWTEKISFSHCLPAPPPTNTLPFEDSKQNQFCRPRNHPSSCNVHRRNENPSTFSTNPSVLRNNSKPNFRYQRNHQTRTKRERDSPIWKGKWPSSYHLTNWPRLDHAKITRIPAGFHPVQRTFLIERSSRWERTVPCFWRNPRGCPLFEKFWNRRLQEWSGLGERAVDTRVIWGRSTRTGGIRRLWTCCKISPPSRRGADPLRLNG